MTPSRLATLGGAAAAWPLVGAQERPMPVVTGRASSDDNLAWWSRGELAVPTGAVAPASMLYATFLHR
jgi:hypothetical protein